MIHTHADRLERWLGPEVVARVSSAMREFYWPVAMHGVPGAVYAMPGGDFTGEIRVGQEMDKVSAAMAYLARERRRHVTRMGHLKRQAGAFGSLDALIAAATGGKKQELFFQKTGPTASATSSCCSLFKGVGQPVAGSAAAASPGGTVPTSATAGALGYANPANANTGHFTTGWAASNQGGNSLLLYDRIFSVAKTMNSTATEAVSGVPTRYQNTTATADDYIGGNFVFPECGTVLAAVAHNWTVCQYTDQAGNAANSLPSVAGVSACPANQIDLVAGQWYMLLASGDVGVKALTQMQASALVTTGAIDFVIGHPICFLPCPISNQMCSIDGVYTALNLTKIFDNACLSLLEVTKPNTSAAIYNGQITVVAE